MKKIGYNVYHAPPGGSEAYLGFVRSLRAARHLAATGDELPEYLYETARAAGHVMGLRAPEEVEKEEPAAWFGRGGYYCAVTVYERDEADQ